MIKLKLFILSVLFALCINIFAQAPENYYNSAQGLVGENLRVALYNIIKNHNSISYSALWDAYKTTDKKPNGKVWDIYSNCNFTFVSDQCGKYSNICDCYNREHTVPQSWFNEASPMKSDLFHVLPTDGKVNGYRSNYPFGENNGTTYGTGKLGSSTTIGYSGIVFEPEDEYKGDIARIYFYMATRYMDKISSWSGESFSGNNLSSWTIKLFLKWHKNDAVSQKEIDRNNAVYNYQNNRNPFVDNPQWVEAIWDENYSNNYIVENKEYASPSVTNDYFKLSLKQQVNKEINIFVYDVLGKLIKMQKQFNGEVNIDLSEIKTGCYIIKINTSSERYFYKIAICR